MNCLSSACKIITSNQLTASPTCFVNFTIIIRMAKPLLEFWAVPTCQHLFMMTIMLGRSWRRMRTTRTHEALSLWHRRVGAVSKCQWNRLAQQRQQDQLRANASLSLPMMDPNLVVLRTEDFVSVSCRIRNSISRCNNRKPHTINSCHGHIFF